MSRAVPVAMSGIERTTRRAGRYRRGHVCLETRMAYSVFLIGPFGEVSGRGEIDASDDAWAVAVCMMLNLQAGRLELWRRGRFVGLIP